MKRGRTPWALSHAVMRAQTLEGRTRSSTGLDMPKDQKPDKEA